MPARSRDGVRLAYEETGRGPEALVFIHGWCCDRSYLAPQTEHFAGRHRVLAVDLRGHGASDAPEQEYTIPGFAADVVWLCDELGIERFVPIGHSLGGVVALELGARLPARVGGVVCIDSALLPPPAVRESVRALDPLLRTADYRKQVRELVSGQLFEETDDPARRERIAERMASRPQHVLVSAWQHLFAYDAEPALRECRAPLLCISAARPGADLARLRSLAPQTHFGQTVGAGHFCQLEVPDQVNAMIERFLRVAVNV